MTVRIDRLFKTAALTALFALCLTAATTVAAKTVTISKSGIDVTLTLSPESFLLGEPTWLTVNVYNDHGLKMQDIGCAFNFPEGGNVNLTIHKQGELPYRYRGTEKPGSFIRSQQTLMWGQSFKREMMILYDEKSPKGLALDKPGYYNMRAVVELELTQSGEKIVADTGWVSVHVLGQSIGEAQAMGLLAGKDVAYALQTGEVQTSAAAAAIRNYLDIYPNGPMAPLCTYTIATSAAQSNPPDYSTAFNTGLDFLINWPRDRRADNVMFSLAYIAGELGKMDLARGWFFYLFDTNPNFPYINPNNTLAYGLYFGCVDKGAKRRWYLYDKPWDFSADTRR